MGNDRLAFITVMEYETGEPVIVNVSSINEVRRGDWGTAIIKYDYCGSPRRIRARERQEQLMERIHAVTQ